jgi:hypothetical protein
MVRHHRWPVLALITASASRSRLIATSLAAATLTVAA